MVSSWLIFSAFAQAAIDVYDFKTKHQEEQFKELTSTLRCPKCQNNTIGDSNSEIAQDLRQKVYEMTREGQSSEEIVQYMTDRYGNFVTYDPPFTLATAVLWFGPLLVVILGFTIMVMNSRKKTLSDQPQRQWDSEKEARLQDLLKDRQNGGKR
nr:cytochrome c-type biogenesis protein [Vibrio albus]